MPHTVQSHLRAPVQLSSGAGENDQHVIDGGSRLNTQTCDLVLAEDHSRDLPARCDADHSQYAFAKHAPKLERASRANLGAVTAAIFLELLASAETNTAATV
jgi:hypothetical protein